VSSLNEVKEYTRKRGGRGCAVLLRSHAPSRMTARGMTKVVETSEKATKVARFLDNARNDKVGAF
jgi:hypothetical protein